MSRPIMEIVLINYRWVFVCLFLLPLSFLYNIFHFLRQNLYEINSGILKHEEKVKKVQKQVLKWNELKCNTKMCTARPGWQTISFRQPLYKRQMYKIDCDLRSIIQIDTKRRIVKVEPQVTMGQLSKALTKIGWTLSIVPELDDLTVGGLIMGTGVESSSHKYGLFQHICTSYELILANGEVLNCSKDMNSDVFYAIPWSYGTIGFLTAAEIQIIPATKFISLKYIPVNGSENIMNTFRTESNNLKNDFVEGIQFNRNQAVVMTGKMIDDNIVDKNKINHIGMWCKPWFFIHVRNYLKSSETHIEHIPLRDYYHRHSRSLFWELQDIIPFGNNIIFRVLFGWLMPVKISLLKLTQTNTVKKLYENNHIIQDMLVPVSKMNKCIEFIDKELNVYPIWLCPINLPNDPGLIHRKKGGGSGEKLYVDIGIYGVPKVKKFHPVRSTRKLEDLVSVYNGYQMLYADTYRNREEFRNMFDHELYDKIRRDFNCTRAFPDVYDKINKHVRS